MAEVIIKSTMKAGDIISVGFNKKKDDIVIKIISKGEEPTENNLDEE